ncbi:MAG: hypothetical protein AB1331_03670 [Bacillota bacterium]
MRDCCRMAREGVELCKALQRHYDLMINICDQRYREGLMCIYDDIRKHISMLERMCQRVCEEEGTPD